jgi:hypothetical protein
LARDLKLTQLCAPNGFRKNITMSLPEQKGLADAVRQGRLTPGQEAQLRDYLACHPEERASWEDELSLNHLLRQMPNAPLSSNFTAQVMQRVVRENQHGAQARPGFWQRWVLGQWLPKLAGVAAVCCIGLLAYQHHEALARREVARTLAAMVATGNSLDLFENFDAIERLNQAPLESDRDLIAVLH